MAGLFSNRHDRSHGGIGDLYSLGDYFCSLGFPFLDFRHRPFALQPISGENDLDLLSAEGKEKWDLKFISPF